MNFIKRFSVTIRLVGRLIGMENPDNFNYVLMGFASIFVIGLLAIPILFFMALRHGEFEDRE